MSDSLSSFLSTDFSKEDPNQNCWDYSQFKQEDSIFSQFSPCLFDDHPFNFHSFEQNGCTNQIDNLSQDFSNSNLIGSIQMADENNSCKKLLSKKRKIFQVNFSIFTKCEDIQMIIGNYLRDFKEDALKKIRKNDWDMLIKKIKSRFLHSLYHAINSKLFTKEKFLYFSKAITSDTAKKDFVPILEMTLEEILQKKADNYEKVIKELKDDKSGMSNFNYFKNMTFKEMYREYINSEEFLTDIYSLVVEEISCSNNNCKLNIKISSENFLKNIKDLFSDSLKDGISESEFKEKEQYVKNYIYKARNFFWYYERN